jgi:hypothetical protein
VKKECINIIIKKTKMGDWFLLYMLGLNIDSIIFKEDVHELARGSWAITTRTSMSPKRPG